HETVDKRSAGVHLLNPTALGKGAYFVAFGWTAADGAAIDLPGETTEWTAEGGPLAPGQPVTLTWTNKDGVKFTRRFEIDRDFLVTVTDSVTNTGTQPLNLRPYSLARQIGKPVTKDFFILHEGPIGVLHKPGEGGVITDPSYSDIKDH